MASCLLFISLLFISSYYCWQISAFHMHVFLIYVCVQKQYLWLICFVFNSIRNSSNNHISDMSSEDLLIGVLGLFQHRNLTLLFWASLISHTPLAPLKILLRTSRDRFDLTMIDWEEREGNYCMEDIRICHQKFRVFCVDVRTTSLSSVILHQLIMEQANSWMEETFKGNFHKFFDGAIREQ